MKLKAMETVQPLPAMSDAISKSVLVSGERGVEEMSLREDLTVDVLSKAGRMFRVYPQNVRWVEPASDAPSPPSAEAAASDPLDSNSERKRK